MRNAAVLAAFALAACAQPAMQTRQVSAARGLSLAGTWWRLVSYDSPNDRTGTISVANPDDHTMVLDIGGRVAMRLSCSSANGTWTQGPADDTSGTLGIHALVKTRGGGCPPESHDARIVDDAQYVETYALRGGLLYLNLAPKGGTYIWAPRPRSRAALLP